MRKLTILIGDYPHTRPLRDGRVTSELIELEFIDGFDPVSSGFDRMVRQQAFDVSEMAIGAFLQGRAAGAPIRLLPVVEVGGFHHSSIRYWPQNGAVAPEDLAGQTLAVRAYSQTTGLWARAILAEQFGIDLDALTWLVTTGSHAERYVDPPNVAAAPPGRTLLDLLRDRDAIAGVLLVRDSPGAEPVIADVRAAEDAWFSEHHTIGINHMICVSDEVAADPALTRELYRMLCAAHALVLGPPSHRELRPGIPSPIREGRDAVSLALELAARYAVQQRLIPSAPALDGLFAEGLSP